MSSIYTFLWTSLKMALRQLMRQKVRSFLTLLGILIGVGAVVAIVSLGEGLRSFFMKSMSSQAAADMVYVMPDVPMSGQRVFYSPKPFKNRDLEMIRGSEYVVSAYAGHILSNATVKHGWRSDTVFCQLVPPEYFPVDNWIIERGRFYTESEARGSAAVCVVGNGIHDVLYEPGEDVLGSMLTVNGLRLEVIGVLKSRSALEGGGDANKMVFLPLQTGQKRLLGSDDIYWVMAKIKDSKQLLQAKEDIASRLRASRRIRNSKDDDFKITTNEDWASFANGFVNTLITVFGAVAIIALVVGGIGVMNIMLVSVRERTREIGLRKAVGATAALITWQFLVEAMTLTITGGLLGLALGYALGFGVSLVMKALWDVFWMPHVPLTWMIIVFGTSIGLGLVFGVYPAWRAGQLDPIVSLRYE